MKSPANTSVVGIVPFQPWLRSLGFSTTTGWRMRTNGLIQTVKIGRRVFISIDEISRFQKRAAAGEFCPECTMAILRSQEPPSDPAPAVLAFPKGADNVIAPSADTHLG